MSISFKNLGHFGFNVSWVVTFNQFFFFLFEPELTPAGRNLLDGRYAVFGYLIDGKEILDKLKEGDEIESATVIQGIENLVQPSAA